MSIAYVVIDLNLIDHVTRHGYDRIEARRRILAAAGYFQGRLGRLRCPECES